MKTKHADLLEMMDRGDWRAALKLAAGFPVLGEHKAAIERGWEALVRPELYRQMGQDPDAHVRAGIAALEERYRKAPRQDDGNGGAA